MEHLSQKRKITISTRLSLEIHNELKRIEKELNHSSVDETIRYMLDKLSSYEDELERLQQTKQKKTI